MVDGPVSSYIDVMFFGGEYLVFVFFNSNFLVLFLHFFKIFNLYVSQIIKTPSTSLQHPYNNKNNQPSIKGILAGPPPKLRFPQK